MGIRVLLLADTHLTIAWCLHDPPNLAFSVRARGSGATQRAQLLSDALRPNGVEQVNRELPLGCTWLKAWGNAGMNVHEGNWGG
jgi:hypothetical protein